MLLKDHTPKAVIPSWLLSASLPWAPRALSGMCIALLTSGKAAHRRSSTPLRDKSQFPMAKESCGEGFAGLSSKESTCQCRRHGSIPDLGRYHGPQSN